MRKTSQLLAPSHRTPLIDQAYDVYPAFPLDAGQIATGFAALAARLAGQRRVVIDGYGGVLWDNFRAQLEHELARLSVTTGWINVDQALLPTDQIENLVAPFLGGDDPLFGTRFNGSLSDFFDADRLNALHAAFSAEPAGDLTILYGSGAALAAQDATLVYLDVPKNEIQFRSRAGSITNLGLTSALPPKVMYKRFYFVDWVALNRHKAALLPHLDWVVDAQRPDAPAVIAGDDLRAGLERMSTGYFRARPWFEPGAWGGQWIKQHIPELPQDVPNYAWSFDLISPENGLMFESSGCLLEVSFDTLMFYAADRVLGSHADQFGLEFPIRFDLLDTFDGGNLSLQCHPRLDYIRRHFGEQITQDETYYILDCKPGAVVYLGFQDSIDPQAFRSALARSAAEATPVDVPRFVNVEAAHRHDLFLIPNGTIHCSGQNVLVLEISATPYIFTFKMYDWLRADLDGRPRPLNIERAFDNLRFDRNGAEARALVSIPRVIDQGADWRIVHLPTHAEHFYDVQRLEFESTLSVETRGSCHVLCLVEGESILLETASGESHVFHYAETFVIPAAAVSYRLTNRGTSSAKVVKAFLKD